LKKLFIYTGPVRSGKSSRLLSFVQNKKDVCGILSPVIDGKKYLYDISSRERRLLEADSQDKEADIAAIGKYKFKKKVFDWGRDVLKKASTQNHTYLIIDEIGQLEFKGKGFSPTVDVILINNNSSIPQIIVVVRDRLVNQFLEHYKLNLENIEFFNFD